MTDNLPSAPLPSDIIDRVAKEVAAQVADHIRFMYPAAAASVSWDSASRSIQGVVRNHMSEAARAAEDGTIDQCLRDQRKRRLRFRKTRRPCRSPRVGEGTDGGRGMTEWQPVETAPHGVDVLLFCPDLGNDTNRARIELGQYSTGRRWPNGASSMSYHSWATHWMPLPAPPPEPFGGMTND